jgi:hypothetical protein
MGRRGEGRTIQPQDNLLSIKMKFPVAANLKTTLKFINFKSKVGAGGET